MALHRTGSRRSFLRRAAVATTGLAGSIVALRFGVFTGGEPEAAPNTAAVADRAAPGGVESPILTALYLDGYKLHTAGRGAGAQREKGDQTLLRGALTAPDGSPAGELFASALTMPGPVIPDAPQTSRLEMQNLQLRDGTLIGMGAVYAQDDLPNRYTIIGGSGRYAGLRGTYLFENNPSVARAEGRARLTFELDT